MGKMIFALSGGLKVERESTYGLDPYHPIDKTPTPTPEPSPEPEASTQPAPDEDSALVKAVKAVEEVVKPKTRRGRPKKKVDAE